MITTPLRPKQRRRCLASVHQLVPILVEIHKEWHLPTGQAVGGVGSLLCISTSSSSLRQAVEEAGCRQGEAVQVILLAVDIGVNMATAPNSCS